MTKQHRGDVLTRIMDQLEFDPFGGCWLFSGHQVNGYGLISVKENGKWVMRAVHRIIFDMLCGPVGDQQVLHKCDVTICFRPDHLFAGNHEANMADMAMKGRSGGPAGSFHRLTDLEREFIRANCIPGERVLGVRAMALKFSVSPTAIRRHVNYQRESHL